jgi:hypothetical protein
MRAPFNALDLPLFLGRVGALQSIPIPAKVVLDLNPRF